ncbi:helix-turn-helix domain-containing protein [Actinoplanes sp. GCM10030250]|uniref:helix-turn-helix domain-containing protein n=1 Tax=Actinoplanes sp. GCM10030250 TaxID=3273376 RepID=UPI00361507C5
MRDLAARLAALDPDAGAALSVIAYFDRLAEGRAGLQAIVRGAAVLAGCPARLSDDGRRIHLRVQPDGTDAAAGAPDPSWMSAEVAGGAVLWLERTGPPGPVEAMILERACGAARAVLERTRGRAPLADPASVELTLDAAAPEQARVQAAGRLGFKTTDRVRVKALASGHAQLIREDDDLPATGERAGVGPSGPVTALPASYAAARTALRFTAEGTEQDPGPRVVHAADLGGLALLADLIGPATEPVPDVRALSQVAAVTPWALATLDAVAESASLRAAAAALRLHHSTLQDRLTHTIPLLGWDVREPRGRLRLQLALALRRLHHNPPS